MSIARLAFIAGAFVASVAASAVPRQATPAGSVPAICFGFGYTSEGVMFTSDQESLNKAKADLADQGCTGSCKKFARCGGCGAFATGPANVVYGVSWGTSESATTAKAMAACAKKLEAAGDLVSECTVAKSYCNEDGAL